MERETETVWALLSCEWWISLNSQQQQKQNKKNPTNTAALISSNQLYEDLWCCHYIFIYLFIFAELEINCIQEFHLKGRVFSGLMSLFNLGVPDLLLMENHLFACKMKLWECFLESIVKENVHVHDCIGVSSSTATCSLMGYSDQKYKHWWRKQLWPPEVCLRTLTPVSEGRGWTVWYNPLFGPLLNLYSTSHCQWIPRFTEENQLSWAQNLIGTFWWLFSAASNQPYWRRTSQKYPKQQGKCLKLMQPSDMKWRGRTMPPWKPAVVLQTGAEAFVPRNLETYPA